nr:VCBS repeat-containing protein [uncultured Shimia sp.]
MWNGARRLGVRALKTHARRVRHVLSAWLAVMALGAVANAEIMSATYADPTTRYDHGILGDAIEFESLVLKLGDGRTVRIRLPDTRVFEDVAPRLADVDGDGAPEVIAIETDLSKGARLSVYGAQGLIAATPFIGRTHRWLAPIGAADLDGDGQIELAYIDRPHLARTLRVWRFQSGALVHLWDQQGLTNHKIGQDYISGGLRACEAKIEMITVNRDWSRIMATSFDGTRTHSRDIGAYRGRASLATALACPSE